MEKKSTIFCDIDGTLFVYRKFDKMLTTPAELINSTAEYIRENHKQGNHIVFTTARPEELREFTMMELIHNDIPYNQIVMGIGRGTRILINDNEFEGENRAIAHSLKRDVGI
jgi:ribonucleotide monophosphatase NagD (HAD superfamily)